VEKRKS